MEQERIDQLGRLIAKHSTRGAEPVSDDLIEQLEAWSDTDAEYGLGARCACLRKAAAEIRTLRAEREQFAENANCSEVAHAAGLAEGVALGIEAAAEAYEIPKDEIGTWDDCCIDTLYFQEAALRNLDPAAIIAAHRAKDTKP